MSNVHLLGKWISSTSEPYNTDKGTRKRKHFVIKGRMKTHHHGFLCIFVGTSASCEITAGITAFTLHVLIVPICSIFHTKFLCAIYMENLELPN